MRKVKIILEYDGTAYGGWQIQPNADTIQQRVEGALREVIREDVRIHGAGRTDAGVHARGQVAHFETGSLLPAENIRDGANTHLPPDIVILRAEDVPASFHARYSARGKIYRYRVLLEPVRAPLERHRACRVSPPLDVAAMRSAARKLTGKHDWVSFAAAGSSIKDTVRTLSRLEITEDGPLIKFELEADGFLYKMVRNIVGTLLETGKGKITTDEMEAILESKDRTRAGPTAPAHGLYLVRVNY